MRKEVWTNEANATFKSNIAFLKKHWTSKEIDAFVRTTFNTLDLLLTERVTGQFDERWNAYKILIVPQIYLFYIIDDNTIVLLSFWNNLQNPL